MLTSLFNWYSGNARKKRGDLFKSHLNPSDETSIVDLGGGTGNHFASILPYRDNVTVADLLKDDLAEAEKNHGFKTLYFDGSDGVPVGDKEFDVVFCSSVIEHVTGPKDDVMGIDDTAEFNRVAFKHQKVFADEIRRIGKGYFVQTPYRYFPIESHSWLPFLIVFLSRPNQKRMINFFNKFWPKTTEPDWYLLTPPQMQELFPDAEIVHEKSMGLTKSLIAIRKPA